MLFRASQVWGRGLSMCGVAWEGGGGVSVGWKEGRNGMKGIVPCYSGSSYDLWAERSPSTWVRILATV